MKAEWRNHDNLRFPRMADAHGGSPISSIVDGSWHLPPTGRNGRAEYEAGHIPGAVFFDLDKDLGHQIRPAAHAALGLQAFAEAAGALGISETMQIVVYDQLGLFSAPRVRWMFQLFGAKRRAARRRPAEVAGRGARDDQ
jgi:thiosulfate/3-mercaptopyruvate sulfurtransferase